MVKRAKSEPTAEELAIWSQGSRTIKQARAETGLSRDELFDLMADGTVRWFAKGLKKTRFLAWGDLVRYLATLHAAMNQK